MDRHSRPVVFAPIFTALLVALVAIACAGTPAVTTSAPSGAIQSGAPAPVDPAPDATLDPGTLDPGTDAAIAFREEMGLRADLGWVQAVAANPDATGDWGVPLLPFEVADLERRQTGEGELVGVVQQYLAEHADISGGMYIDQPLGGVVTVLVTDDPAPHEAALEATLGPDAVAVRQVRWTEQELNDLQAKVTDVMDDIAAIPAQLTTTSTDVIGNQVEVTVSSAVPDVATRIAALVGAAEGQLRVVSDGTGILLLPTGRIEGRVVAPPGTDLTALSPTFQADVDIGPRDGPLVVLAPDGRFTLADLPPTGYTVTILETAVGGNEVGSARVVVPPGGVATVEIPYEGP